MIKRFDLSCAECSPAGMFLGRLYYQTQATDLFTNNERSGFPNDGGQHTLRLRVRDIDIRAFLELIKERYGEKRGCPEFLEHGYAQLN